MRVQPSPNTGICPRNERERSRSAVSRGKIRAEPTLVGEGVLEGFRDDDHEVRPLRREDDVLAGERLEVVREERRRLEPQRELFGNAPAPVDMQRHCAESARNKKQHDDMTQTTHPCFFEEAHQHPDEEHGQSDHDQESREAHCEQHPLHRRQSGRTLIHMQERLPEVGPSETERHPGIDEQNKVREQQLHGNHHPENKSANLYHSSRKHNSLLKRFDFTFSDIAFRKAYIIPF